MKKNLLLFLCLLITSFLFQQARSQSTIGNQNVDQFKVTASGNTLEYGLTWLPASYASNPSKKYPLIIFLHGSGQAGTTLTKLSDMITHGIPAKIAAGFQPAAVNPRDGQTYEFIVCSPMDPNWAPTYTTLQYILPDILSRYHVDTNRIYFTGFSAGGGEAYGCASVPDTSFVKKIAAVASSSAYGIDDAGSWTSAVLYARQRYATPLYGVHAWAVVGAWDATIDDNTGHIDSMNLLSPAPPNKLTVIDSLDHTPTDDKAWDTAFRPKVNSYGNNAHCSSGCPTITAPNNNGSPIRGTGVTQDSLNVFEWLLLYSRGSTPPPPPPVAHAGSDQTITLPTDSVILSASTSTGVITSYAWSKISGPSTYTIVSPTSSTTSVTGLVQGAYGFQLSLNGGVSKDTVIITVNADTTGSGGGGGPVQKGHQNVDSFPTNATGTSSVYGLTWLPTSYGTDSTKRYPLIIYLHGYSNRGSGTAGLDTLTKVGLPKKIADGFQPVAVNPKDGHSYEFIVVSPQDPSWTINYTTLKYILPNILSRYHVDSTRVYLTGSTTGGDGVFTCVGSGDSTFIKKFAAVATASSGGVDGVNGLTDVQVEGQFRYTTKTYGVQAWTVAGDQDGNLDVDVRYHDSLNVASPAIPDKLTVISSLGNDTTWVKLYDSAFRPSLNYYGNSVTCSNGCAAITAPNTNGSPVRGSGITQDSLNIYEWLLLSQRNSSSSGSGGGGGSTCHGIRHILTPYSDSSVYMTSTTSPSTTAFLPGDTLVLNTAYTSVDLSGVHGTASCPIVIINDSIQALITLRLTLNNCTYVKVTGSGTADPYGILIQQDPHLRQQSYHAIGIASRSKNIEVERVYMHNVDIGIVCETNADCGDSLNYPNWILDSMSFHHNRIVGTWNEGMYIGNTSPDNASYDPRPVTCGGVTSYPAPMKNGYTLIHDNYVDSTGRGGIQLANAVVGVSEIYNNTVRHNGLNGDEGQGTGISLGLYTRAYIHNNSVSNTYTWGIVSLGAGATGIPLRIENNTIDSSGYLSHYDLASTSRIVYDPSTEPVLSDALTWPQAIEIDTRPRHYTTDTTFTGTAVVGQDSTQFLIRTNTIGLKKNSIAINVEDDYSGLQKSGNYICGNLNAGSGTQATDSVVSGIGFSRDCSGLTVTRTPIMTEIPSFLDPALPAELVNVYPNPIVQNTLILSAQNGKTGRMIVSIYDINGKLVQQNVFTKENAFFQQTLSLQHLTHGMYLLRLQFEKGGKPYTFKLIKE